MSTEKMFPRYDESQEGSQAENVRMSHELRGILFQ
jgi:hypothetical protein